MAIKAPKHLKLIVCELHYNFVYIEEKIETFYATI